ncbi:MAG TPA: hypothetical protein VFH36_01365 [Acidimicrobiales bacterium]|nr:hypothetical protein [Acidimicrobiales bacterium]
MVVLGTIDADRPADDRPAGEAERGPGVALRARWLVVVALAPLVVSAVALVAGVGGAYHPTGDQAGTELAVRAVGRHEVLTGLWSRELWAHPGPLSFYLLAPVYWLTGGASIGLNLGALAINGAAVGGMAVVALRRGGRPLALCTLVACALVMRTLGADLVHEFQNIYIVTLPFGLMVFLTWAMTCREAWALPAGMVVAAFLAQTHVGFVALALPLLAAGSIALVVAARRAGELGSLRRPGAVAAGLSVLLWSPLVADVIVNVPSNTRRIIMWFQGTDEEPHSLVEGWRVVTGQFGWRPEWLTGKALSSWSGESPFLLSSPVPVLLTLVALAGVALWRRGGDGRRLVAVLVGTLALSVVAVARTLGPVFDYRLRWTWMPPLVAFVVVAWAAWRAAVARWGPRADLALSVVAAATLVVASGMNIVDAATAGTPQRHDSDMVADLMPDIVEALDPDAGPVVVSDPWTPGSWYGRAVVLQLERRGFDARVDPAVAIHFTPHHAYGPDRPVQARLLVLRGDMSEAVEGADDVDLLARAGNPGVVDYGEVVRQAEAMFYDLVEQGMSDEDAFRTVGEAIGDDLPEPPTDPDGFADMVSVYLDERPPGSGDWSVPR